MACNGADFAAFAPRKSVHAAAVFPQDFPSVPAGLFSLPFRYKIWHFRIKSTAYAFRVAGTYHPGEHHFQTLCEVSKMASSALSRVSGSVLSVPPAREYTFPAGHERAGEKLTFEKLNILVADMNVTAVDLPRRDSTGTFENLYTREFGKGEQVDFLVETSIYRGDLQIRVLGLWPNTEASSLAGVLAADSFA